MSGRSYEHVEFRPWYVPDTAGWLGLSLAARGLVAELVRKFDKRGELAIRRLEDLCILLRLSWDEVEPAIAELLSKGRLQWDESAGVLCDPDFVDRMRQGSAARMHRKRSAESERREASSRKSEPPSQVTRVTDVTRVTRVTDVTPSDACDGCDEKPSPLIYSDLISSKKEDVEEIQSARARPTQPTTPAVLADPASPEPSWWADVIGTIGQGTGVDLPPREAWLRYAGHRASKDRPAERRDAVHWLTTVMVKEAREIRDKARHQRERDAKFDKLRAGPASPADNQKLTVSEQVDLAERFPMRRRNQGAA